MNVELRNTRKFKPLKYVTDMILPFMWVDEVSKIYASMHLLKHELRLFIYLKQKINVFHVFFFIPVC